MLCRCCVSCSKRDLFRQKNATGVEPTGVDSAAEAAVCQEKETQQEEGAVRGLECDVVSTIYDSETNKDDDETVYDRDC